MLLWQTFSKPMASSSVPLWRQSTAVGDSAMKANAIKIRIEIMRMYDNNIFQA